VARAGLDFLGILCGAAILLLRAAAKAAGASCPIHAQLIFSNHVMVALLFHDGSALVRGL
jgi:hypothetical protein